MATVLRGADPDSPEGQVLSMWYFAQWGSLPNVVDSYLPAVRRAVGAEEIAAAFSQQRQVFLMARPKVRSVRQTPRGAFVALEVGGKPPTFESFLLQRSGGRWRIAYDTLFERMYMGIVHGRVSLEGRRGGDVERVAQQRAAKAAALYRSVSLSLRP